MSTCFRSSALFRACAPACLLVGALGCGGEIDAPFRTCNLPTSDVHVVDVADESIDLMFAVMSDGTMRWWGEGYPVADYGPVAEPYDEACVTAIDADSGKRVALSYDGSITLLYFDKFAFDVGEEPVTLPPPTDASIVAVRADRDFLFLDGSGAVWVLWSEFESGDRPPGSGLVQVPLPAPAVDISTDAGFCAALVDGTVWCQDYIGMEELGRFGLGDSPDVKELTKLSINDAVQFSLEGEFSCYLDAEGTIRCAGGNRSEVLGYDSAELPDQGQMEGRPWFDVVPGVPPLKRIWLQRENVCGQSLDDELWCWGANAAGQLMPAETQEEIRPTQVAFFPGMKDVAMSEYTVCILLADNRVVCRGLSATEDQGCGYEGGWLVMNITGCEEASP